MDRKKKIEQLQNRAERVQYTGKYDNLQAFGSSYKGERYSTAHYEKDPYNQYQNFLYKRALFGIKIYKPDELKIMHPEKIERVKKVHKHGQRTLNTLKQQKLIEITNKFFAAFTGNASLAGEIIDMYSNPDPNFISKNSFKELGLDKEMVIDALLKDKVLPRDFNTITQ